MSFIAAAGAKNRAQSWFGNDSFDAFDTVGSGMKSSAAEYIAETENQAKRDYFADVGQTKLDGIKKLGGAQMTASNDAFIGGLGSMVGSAAMGVSSYGQKHRDWGK